MGGLRRLVPLLVVLVAALVGALRAADMKKLPGDFLRYHRAGRLVATGRADLLYDRKFLHSEAVYADERTPDGDPMHEYEFKYAPALAVTMAPLGALPARTANVIWGAWNAALIASMFLAAWAWCAQGRSAWWMLVPLAVLVRPVADNVNDGQLNPSALVPATLGLWLISKRRDAAGGALVGLGAAVKYMPAVLLVWLAWQRRWKAVAAALAVVALLGVAIPAAVLGPSRSVALTKEWIDVRSHVYTTATPPDVPGYSMKSFVYRALGDTPYITGEGEKRVVREAPHASLPPEILRAAVIAADLALVAAALWFTRRREDLDDPIAASMWLAALLLVSPEARFPHFLYLALPLVALTYALRRGTCSTRARGALVLALAGAYLLNATSGRVAGESLSKLAEFYCAPGWGALLLGAALVLVLPRAATSSSASSSACLPASPPEAARQEPPRPRP